MKMSVFSRQGAKVGSAVALALLAGGCKTSSETGTKPAAPAVAVTYDKVAPAEFNALAVELALPLFWMPETASPGTLAPDELAVLWGPEWTARDQWVAGGKFTPRFDAAYRSVVERREKGPSEAGLTQAEVLRRALVRQELGQARPTIVRTETARWTQPERQFLQRMSTAARLIEEIYALQRGAAAWSSKVEAGDTASRAMFFRNQGPWCEAPATESDPACSAVPQAPKEVVGLYPAALQQDSGFCSVIEKLAGEAAKKPAGAPAVSGAAAAPSLTSPFDIVTGTAPDGLKTVPYSLAYGDKMKAVASELDAAAAGLPDDEAALRDYLRAAATAFRTNDWFAADVPWSKMNARNSKWYLRIGPDETYSDPCSLKAGFHMSLARINPDSPAWDQKLVPVQQAMEDETARLAGAPYAAKKVGFQLPALIDIVLNAGNSRSAFGATIGQSLPNWGPVAAASEGRTVVMTNLYQDEMSRSSLKEKAASLFCADTMAGFSTDAAPFVLSVVLHEMAHNLGPSHEYRVRGETDDQVFGGPLAAMMEELKAQTSALYFTDWLASRGVVTKALADETHIRDVAWAFGHIARGMTSPDGKIRPYSQLAAVQLGWLIQKGAVTWREDKAANGKDLGCFSLDATRYAPAVASMMKRVEEIKAQGDVKGAELLQGEFVSGDDDKARHESIRERWMRGPKESFVYSFEY